MPDPWEFHRSLNPDDPKDGWQDPDGDGVLNIYEYFLGTDPRDPLQPKYLPYQSEQTLEAFIAAAPRGVVLQIPEGEYVLRYNHSSALAPPRIMIQGGWKADFSERDICVYSTTLIGGDQPIFNYQLLDGNSSAIILDGLRLMQSSSGAVRHISYVSKVQLLLANCLLASNVAHPSSAILYFEDGAGTLISDLILINTTIANNSGSAIRFEQSANRSNFKLLHSLIAYNEISAADDPPYRSGYGLSYDSFADSLIQLQLLNSIVWGNGKADVLLNNSGEPETLVDSRHNIYGFFENDPNAQFFQGPTDRSIDPLLVESPTHSFGLATTSPARSTGIPIGFGAETAINLGSELCADLLNDQKDREMDDPNWGVYPNPSPDGFYLIHGLASAKALDYQIIDTCGRVLKKGKVPAIAAQEPYFLEAQDWPDGLYFLRATTPAGRLHLPLLKIR